MLKFKHPGAKMPITETECFLIGSDVRYKDMIGTIKFISNIEYWIKWEGIEGVTVYPKEQCELETITTLKIS